MIIKIQAENEGNIPEEKRQILLRFTQQENQYSLMFKVALEALIQLV